MQVNPGNTVRRHTHNKGEKKTSFIFYRERTKYTSFSRRVWLRTEEEQWGVPVRKPSVETPPGGDRGRENKDGRRDKKRELALLLFME